MLKVVLGQLLGLEFARVRVRIALGIDRIGVIEYSKCSMIFCEVSREGSIC